MPQKNQTRKTFELISKILSVKTTRYLQKISSGKILSYCIH